MFWSWWEMTEVKEVSAGRCLVLRGATVGNSTRLRAEESLTRFSEEAISSVLPSIMVYRYAEWQALGPSGWPGKPISSGLTTSNLKKVPYKHFLGQNIEITLKWLGNTVRADGRLCIV